MPRGERRGRSVLTTCCDLNKKRFVCVGSRSSISNTNFGQGEARFPSLRGAKVSRSVGHRALPETMLRGRRRGRSDLTTEWQMAERNGLLHSSDEAALRVLISLQQEYLHLSISRRPQFMTVRGLQLSYKSHMPRGERRGRSVLTAN
jgi:hypothetical protein